MKESETFMATLNEGREEGLAVGLANGERRIILRLGSEKFGPPAGAVSARLQSVTELDELERLASRVLTANNWNELLD